MSDVRPDDPAVADPKLVGSEKNPLPDSAYPDSAYPDSAGYPDSVGPYRIVDRIGSGGMGVVYRARDERLERWVAIKHIRPGEADLRSRERLRREARTVAGLSHPAIVQVHDIVETPEGDWIVMELVEGKTLKQLADDDDLSMGQVLRLAREIAEGLAEAHAKGVVHRDLKTENVKITELGHAKILDFGLAKRVFQGPQEESLSVQGAILGTGRAMSPEQALGEDVNHLSDLFSFGTLLFETVTRRPPFVGSSLILTMAQICTEDQPSARDLVPSVPRQLSDLIDHLLQKDPLQRPQSAGEVVEALQRISARLASHAVGDDPSEPSDTAEVPIVSGAPVSGAPAVAPGPAVARLSTRSSGVRPITMSRSSESTAGIFIKTLVETSLVDSSKMGDRFGDADAYELFSRHDRMARDVLAEHDGLEVHRTDDGFLFLFERPVDAVEFVLAYHQRLAEFGAEVDLMLEARASIHLSEIFLRENTAEEIHRGAKPFEVEGLAKLLVSRVVALGHGGQTLLTQEAYDMTRRALVGHSLAERKLHWRNHGRFDFRGVEEPVQVFEVSAEPIASDLALLEDADARSLGEDSHTALRPAPRRLLGWAAALILLAATGALLREGIGQWSRGDSGQLPEAVPQTPEAPRRSLAVLGFRHLGQAGEPSGDDLSTTLTTLLSTNLGASEDLRLVAGETVARMKNAKAGLLENDTLAPDTLERLQSDFSSDYVILGSYLVLGEDQLSVQLTLQDTFGDLEIFAIQELGTQDEILELVARLAGKVRARLNLAVVPRETVLSSLSDYPEANNFYSSGKQRLLQFDILGARDDFLEACRLDRSFALAHAALARTYLTLGYDESAARSGRRAYELSEDLRREESLSIEATYYESIGELESAISSQQTLWHFYPDELEYGLRLADLQIMAKSGDAALETVESLRRLPPPIRDDPRIDLVEAQAALAGSGFAQALEAADRALAKGRPRGFSRLVAEAQRVRGRSLLDFDRVSEARQALEEAERLFEELGDELGRGTTLLNFSYLESKVRNLSRAEEHFVEALRIFRGTGTKRSILRAQYGLAYMIQGQGRLQEARELLEEAVEVARDMNSRQDEVIALDTLTLVLYQLGELGRAERLVKDGIVICQELGDRRTEAWFHVNLGLTLLSAGRLYEAQTVYDTLLALSRASSSPDASQWAGLALNGLGAVHFALDELAAAEEYFDRYHVMLGESDQGELAFTAPVYAWTLLESGRTEEAYESARDIARRFREAEQPIYEVASLRVAAEALWRLGRYDEAHQQLEAALRNERAREAIEQRLWLEVSEFRFLGTEEPRKAIERLRPLIGKATQLNLKQVEMGAFLVLGRLETRLAGEDPELGALGRAHLQALADDAARNGFKLVARQARAASGATAAAN